MTLTKEPITRSVLDRLELSKAASANSVQTTFEIIKKTLEGGEDVLISGFGKFCVKNKGNRKGRNPWNGEGLMLAEGRVVTFKCWTVLKRKLNGGQGLALSLYAAPNNPTSAAINSHVMAKTKSHDIEGESSGSFPLD